MEELVRPVSLAGLAGELVGTVEVHDYVEQALDRIATVDDTIEAFVIEPRRADRVRAAVRERVGSAPQGPLPLPGILVGIKDIIHVNGLLTKAGSTLPTAELAGPQAAVVNRLLDAGAIIGGKTVTAEFAVAAPGPTRNPHHLEHTPGGSSSGSAAAVAAGLVPLAIGTQTIASLIRPAAYCGVVGFKPTHGRIPMDGVLPVSPSYDTLGVFTATVADAALAAGVLCDDWAEAAAPESRPVLGIPEGPYLAFTEAEALAAFEEQVGRLHAAGYAIKRVPVFEDFERESFDLFVVNLYELARSHDTWFARFADRYDDRTAEAIRQGQRAQASDYAGALRSRGDFCTRLADTTDDHGIDLWIAPAATGPAPHGLASAGDSVMSLPWSAAGLPSLTIPAGRSKGGLPLGMQFAGRHGADESLLGWAAGLERALSAGVTEGA
ncbi:amidase [Streptomyces boninensis]|uniref:amidase n=1 Tax=Streptomyces boninensis TaxID=2039455 RepID=UPI003B21689C